MKTKNMIWAALSMTAALVMTACSNDDNTVETPAAQQAIVKTIPYSVTVNGSAGTRATVDNDMKTLKFATGDKLYITGTNISGVLALKSGDEGKSSGATFEGDLTYTGEGSPASDLSLTATLVSAQQTDGTEVTINSTTKAVTVNYPTTAYCADVATAVQKYSNLTGTSTYSAKSFTLSQNTAFLNFEITFVDGTTTSTELSAVVKNGATNLCTANVTTTTVDTKVVAKFVLPVAKNTALSGATVTMGTKAARAINDATLDGKVYNVKKTQAATLVTAITLNKTETSIEVGSTETLSVTAVAPDNATDKTYTWKTSDESKATVDQDGKVTAVAAGTVTIYAEANDGSGVKGNCTVTVTPATITVTWNNDDITGSGNSFTKDGVTITAREINYADKGFYNGGTITTTLGNFTKIEVTAALVNISGTGWSGSGSSMTWAGNASSVSFSGDIVGMGQGKTKLVFTIQPN